MSQRELEQRVRNILDQSNSIGGCCHACCGSGLILTDTASYGSGYVGGAQVGGSWRDMFEIIKEITSIVRGLFSSSPSDDTPAESACRIRLRQEGIIDRKSFNQWARRNHPDKVPVSEKQRATELFQDLINCLKSEGLGGGYVGGELELTQAEALKKWRDYDGSYGSGYVGGYKKGQKMTNKNKQAIKSGGDVYRAFMKGLKDRGLTRDEALDKWREYKKDRTMPVEYGPRNQYGPQNRPEDYVSPVEYGPQNRPADYVSPVEYGPQNRPADYVSRPTRAQCEKMYGQMGMPVQGMNVNDPSLANKIQAEIITDLSEQTAPDWSGNEQLREALDLVEYGPQNRPADYVSPVVPIGYEDEYARFIGDGRPKGSKNKKPRKDKGVKRGQNEGLRKYQEFIKCMKNSGLTHKEAAEMYKDMKAKHGGNWWDSFKKGFMLPFEAASKILPIAAML
jgi:hypothetical protein